MASSPRLSPPLIHTLYTEALTHEFGLRIPIEAAHIDRALDDPRGIRVELRGVDSATHLRMRIHQARQIDRRENATTYSEPDHPLHGRSPYDCLTLRIDPGPPCWLYLDKIKVEIGRVETIPEDYQIEPPKAPLALAPPLPQVNSHPHSQIRRR